MIQMGDRIGLCDDISGHTDHQTVVRPVDVIGIRELGVINRFDLVPPQNLAKSVGMVRPLLDWVIDLLRIRNRYLREDRYAAGLFTFVRVSDDGTAGHAQGDRYPDWNNPASTLTIRQPIAHNSPNDTNGNATPRLSLPRLSTKVSHIYPLNDRDTLSNPI